MVFILFWINWLIYWINWLTVCLNDWLIDWLIDWLAKRSWLLSFHKKADKHRWSVERYNKLKQVSSSVVVVRKNYFSSGGPETFQQWWSGNSSSAATGVHIDPILFNSLYALFCPSFIRFSAIQMPYSLTQQVVFDFSLEYFIVNVLCSQYFPPMFLQLTLVLFILVFEFFGSFLNRIICSL